MKVKKSDLIISKLWILVSDIETIPVTPQCKQPVFDDIELDIDYNILTNSKDQPAKFKILLSLAGNFSENPKPGYSFNIVSQGVFKINDLENTPKPQVDKFLSFSALPMVISYVRSYLMNTTTYYPFGKYTLPSIDLNVLVKEKTDIILKKNKKLSK